MTTSVPPAAYEIARRHRVPAEQVVPLPVGVANHVVALGDRLVLRVPRAPEFEADLRKESALVPVVHGAGVSTPALVEYADPPGGVPHMLIERLPGTDMADRAPAPKTLIRLGRELARIHRIPVVSLPELPHDDSDQNDHAPLVERLHRLGHIDAEAARWLHTWGEQLSGELPETVAPTLVHGDLAPQNLLMSPGGALTGIVDWGDAALADPATDFAKLPPWWLPPVLEGYRHERGEGTGHPWEARVLWYHLTWALGRLDDPVPSPGARHWTAPPSSRLLGLLRLFSSSPPAPWAALAPRPWPPMEHGPKISRHLSCRDQLPYRERTPAD